MIYVPRDYQWEAAYYLSRRSGALLGLECGLGKTLATLLAMQLARLDFTGRTLIVCPPNLKRWWEQEVQKVINAPVTVYRGQIRPGEYHDVSKFRGVVIAHYPQFQGKIVKRSKENVRPITRPLIDAKWDAVILDECHWIKSRDAQRTRLLKSIKSKYRWGLSGTLVAEFPQDLWSPLNWADRKRWPHYWPFVEEYCQTDIRYVDGGDRTIREIIGVKPVLMPNGRYSEDPTLQVLRLNTKDTALIMTRQDVGLQLPPVSIINVPLVMEVGQAHWYKRVEEEAIIELVQEFGEPDVWDLRQGEQSLVIKNALSRLTRLLQISSAPTVFWQGAGNCKLDWLKDYLDSGGPPAVIFTRFTHTAHKIKELLEGRPGFVVGTYQALGEGQNFQYLDTLIAWDPAPSRFWWEQARYRIDRLGQTRPCTVYRLQCSQVDEKSWDLIDYKDNVVEMITTWLRGLYDKKME